MVHFIVVIGSPTSQIEQILYTKLYPLSNAQGINNPITRPNNKQTKQNNII